QMDNKGNRVILPDSESAINIPAVAAAHSIRNYVAQSADELSLNVGDILSIIDKPPSNESSWWRGKKEFEVGFFPSDCVELLESNKIPQSIACRYAVNSIQLKHCKSCSLLMSFFSTRPNRSSLKRTGIVKERLFACDLGEHLLNSGEDVPTILRCCSEVLEVYGIVDGIYRLSGAASTINKLRHHHYYHYLFDEGKTPQLSLESYKQDIHSISSLLKMYFRELPNPLLTYQLYDSFIEAITEREESVRLSKICDVIKQLPPPHYRSVAVVDAAAATATTAAADDVDDDVKDGDDYTVVLLLTLFFCRYYCRCFIYFYIYYCNYFFYYYCYYYCSCYYYYCSYYHHRQQRTAEFLFRHLNKMASHDKSTSMHCKNLAIVWAPNLLR
ncbi:hypothetical protein HELRODRAFT_85587, partial [Helobdella robusta]|uniref:SH3 domain-containing protein n=1 Tax=Helobdella robusta TaxID=6412 RepID=T1G601_HELRO